MFQHSYLMFSWKKKKVEGSHYPPQPIGPQHLFLSKSGPHKKKSIDGEKTSHAITGCINGHASIQSPTLKTNLKYSRKTIERLKMILKRSYAISIKI